MKIFTKQKLHIFLKKYINSIFYCTLILIALAYSCLSIVRHMHFQSGAFDLGIFDQTLWQYAHFLFPYSTIKEKFILGDHLNLTLPLLAPLYWIWDDVRVILLFQACWITFSTIGIYWYLQERTFTKLQSALLSYLYIFFYGIQFAVFFDFHPIVLGVGLMAWLLYFWESKKWKLFWLSIFFLLLTQENTGIGLFGLCCVWFFQKKHRYLVIFLAILGLITTGFSFYLIHIFSQGHLQYIPRFAQTIPGIIYAFYDQPEKRSVWLYSYSSFAFLPLLSLGSFIAVIVDTSQYFITGNDFNHMWSPFLHHRAILAIFLVVGVADVSLFLKSKKWNLTVLVIFLFLWSILVTYHFHFAITKLTKKDFWQNEQWMIDNTIVMQHIPQQVSLATQQSLVPHVSHREEIYLVYPRQGSLKNTANVCVKNCWWLDFSGKPHYLFIDEHAHEWLTMTLVSSEQFLQAVQNMEKTHVIQLFYKKGEARLYKINYAVLAKVKPQ